MSNGHMIIYSNLGSNTTSSTDCALTHFLPIQDVNPLCRYGKLLGVFKQYASPAWFMVTYCMVIQLLQVLCLTICYSFLLLTSISVNVLGRICPLYFRSSCRCQLCWTCCLHVSCVELALVLWYCHLIAQYSRQ